MSNMIDIVVNATDRASKTIRGINKSMQGMADRAERASALTNKALGGIAVGLGAVALAGINQNKVMEESDARWSTLLDSSAKAEKQMKWMKDYAKTTPFNYKAIDETATALNGMGLEVEQVNKWLPALGDASAVLGGGSETVKGLGMALGQMNAKGKVSAEEMQQLAERGVNAWGMLADGMGMTQAEVRKLSEDGKLLAKDALPLIYEGMNKTFGGGTQKLMKSTAGQAMLAKENFNMLAGSLTKGAYDKFGATVLPMINKSLEWLQTTFEGGVIQGFKDLWSGSEKAKITLLAIAGTIGSLLIPSLISIGGAVLGAVVAFAPFLASGMAIAGLAYLIYNNWGVLKPYFDKLWGGIKSTFETVKTALQNGWSTLIGFWNNNKATVFDTLKTVWNTLKTTFTTVKNSLVEGWNFLTGLWESKGDSVKGVFEKLKTVWNTLKTAFEVGKTVIVSVAQMIWTNLQTMWTNLQPVLIQLKGLWDTLKNAFETVKPIIITLATIIGGALAIAFTIAIGVINGIVRAISPLISAVINVIDFIINLGLAVIKVFQGDFAGAFAFAKTAFENLMQAVGNIIEAIIQFFVGFVQGVWSIIRPFATDLWNKFTEMMTNAWNAVTDGVSNIISSIGGFVSDMIAKAIELKNDFKNKIGETMTGAVSAIGDGISGMLSEAGSWVSEFVKSGAGLVGGFIDGIVSKAGDIASAVGGALEKARDLLPFSPAKKGPLSDLDKSGASFFPTFAGGMKKGVSNAVRMAHSGMSAVNAELNKGAKQGVQLESFGGSSRSTVIHEFRHTGSLTVEGSSGESEKVAINQLAGTLEERVTAMENVFGGTRQAIRMR